MNIFKKLFSKIKSKKNKEAKNEESWYNNSGEKERKLWTEPTDGGYYDGADFEMAQTNQISKRQG